MTCALTLGNDKTIGASRRLASIDNSHESHNDAEEVSGACFQPYNDIKKGQECANTETLT